MDPMNSSESESRSSAYFVGLAGVIGHADPASSLRDCRLCLWLTREHKRGDPLAAMTAPACREPGPDAEGRLGGASQLDNHPALTPHRRSRHAPPLRFLLADAAHAIPNSTAFTPQ